MISGALKHALRRLTRIGLAGLDRPTARYVQGSTTYLLMAVASAVPFEVFFLIADAGALWPAALVQGLLMAIWMGCLRLNATGWVRTSSVVALAAPLIALTAQTWFLSYRAGFLLPMFMTATVASVTMTPRLARWAVALSIGSAVALAWSFLDPRVAEPTLDVSRHTVDGLLVANVVLVTVVTGLTSWLNHHYFTRERRRAERRIEAAQDQARTDPLTRLMNRRGMVEAFAAAPLNKAYAVTLVDLDRFKDVNDTLGHSEGDQVLAEVAGILRDSIGDSGIVSRWGGEEFLVLMTDTHLTTAVAGVERARKAVEARASAEGGGHVVTFSAGLAVATPGLTWESAVRVADALLYDAKAAGRNRVRYTQIRGDLSE